MLGGSMNKRRVVEMALRDLWDSDSRSKAQLREALLSTQKQLAFAERDAGVWARRYEALAESTRDYSVITERLEQARIRCSDLEATLEQVRLAAARDALVHVDQEKRYATEAALREDQVARYAAEVATRDARLLWLEAQCVELQGRLRRWQAQRRRLVSVLMIYRSDRRALREFRSDERSALAVAGRRVQGEREQAAAGRTWQKQQDSLREESFQRGPDVVKELTERLATREAVLKRTNDALRLDVEACRATVQRRDAEIQRLRSARARAPLINQPAEQAVSSEAHPAVVRLRVALDQATQERNDAKRALEREQEAHRRTRKESRQHLDAYLEVDAARSKFAAELADAHAARESATAALKTARASLAKNRPESVSTEVLGTSHSDAPEGQFARRAELATSGCALTNEYVTAWLLASSSPEAAAIEKGWIATDGHGPWNTHALEYALDTIGFDRYLLPDADIEYLVVGREGWSKNGLLEQLEVRAGRPLRFYSQEMFSAKLITGRDPFDEGDTDLLQAFARGHPALRYLMTLTPAWPGLLIGAEEAILEVDRYDDQVTESPLHILGYHVGISSSLTIRERRELLRRCSEIEKLAFSNDSSQLYRLKWGGAGTKQRNYRIATHLESLIDGRVGLDPRKSQARKDWIDDLAWFRNTLQPSDHGVSKETRAGQDSRTEARRLKARSEFGGVVTVDEERRSLLRLAFLSARAGDARLELGRKLTPMITRFLADLWFVVKETASPSVTRTTIAWRERGLAWNECKEPINGWSLGWLASSEGQRFLEWLDSEIQRAAFKGNQQLELELDDLTGMLGPGIRRHEVVGMIEQLGYSADDDGETLVIRWNRALRPPIRPDECS